MEPTIIEGSNVRLAVRRLTRGDRLLVRMPLTKRFATAPEDADAQAQWLFAERWNFICASTQVTVLDGALQLASIADDEATFEAKFEMWLALDDRFLDRVIAALNEVEAPIGEPHMALEVPEKN